MSKSVYEMVKHLKQSGLTYAEIGQRLGFSRQRAQQLLSPTKAQRQVMLNKCGGVCQECGKESQTLHAHHESYSVAASKMLCTSCHMKHHGGGRGVSSSRYLRLMVGAFPENFTDDKELLDQLWEPWPPNPAITKLITATQEQGITNEQFAKALRVEVEVVECWKKGQGEPETAILIRLLVSKLSETWAREWAWACLNARYPGVFIRVGTIK